MSKCKAAKPTKIFSKSNFFSRMLLEMHFTSSEWLWYSLEKESLKKGYAMPSSKTCLSSMNSNSTNTCLVL